jgi:putative endonuclease
VRRSEDCRAVALAKADACECYYAFGAELRLGRPVFFSTLAAASEGVDCRAVALAKAELFDLVDANAASYDSASQMMKNAKFFYIYILQSELHAERFYTGLTDDLRKRMRNHNARRVLHTTKWRPWHLKAYVAIFNRLRGAEFERYLKSASGRAFARKRL